MPGEPRNPGRAEMPEPAESMNMTIFLTVRDIVRSRAFYTDVLGGAVAREEDPCMVKIANSWVLMNPGGGPTQTSRISPWWRRSPPARYRAS
jgi:catechol 2,3-dioxygenase-like lactoylglutathione lyase family enzyme